MMVEVGETAIIQAKVLISGRVQGVGYRVNTQRQARQLGLTGWVQNLRDGRVEALFEGSSQQVEAMLKWCHLGPLSAKVTDVAVSYTPAEGMADFKINY
jgi:acylphosphatase